jgi:hypothetical protein
MLVSEGKIYKNSSQCGDTSCDIWNIFSNNLGIWLTYDDALNLKKKYLNILFFSPQCQLFAEHIPNA